MSPFLLWVEGASLTFPDLNTYVCVFIDNDISTSRLYRVVKDKREVTYV